MRKLFTLLIMTLLPLMASADAVEIDSIYYNLDTEALTAEVTSNPDRYKGDIVVPPTVIYEDVVYDVTSVGNSAFASCSWDLTSVKLPDGITSIGNSAFEYCYTMTSVNIPTTVTSIGSSAFQSCNKLTSIAIPEGVVVIDKATFSGCSSLESLIIPSSVTSIYQSAFSGCQNVKSIYIHANVSLIEDGAFSRCLALEEFIVDADNATYDSRDNCNALIRKSDNALIFACKSSTVPDGVERIESSVFSYSNVTSVVIPQSVSYISKSAFRYCPTISSIKVADGNTKYDSRDNCNAIIETATNALFMAPCKDFTIPASVTTIGKYAFSYTSGLESVTIPQTITSIDPTAFLYNTSLTALQVEEGNMFYDSRDNCNAIIETATNTLLAGISTTVIPSTVTTIGGNAFEYNSTLASISIPEGVNEISISAFLGCQNLKSVYLPSTMTTIGLQAFWNCKSLTDIYCRALTPPTIEEPASTISSANIILHVLASAVETYQADETWSQFKEIKGMTVSENNIVFEDALVKSICVEKWDTGGDGELSFEEAEAVTEIEGSMFYNKRIKTFNEMEYFTNLKVIGPTAFHFSDIGSVKFPKSLEEIGSGAFDETAIGSIDGGVTKGDFVFPDHIKTLRWEAFACNGGIHSVTIPASVTKIEPLCFRSCKNLASFTVDEANPVYKIVDGWLIEKDTLLVFSPLPQTIESLEIPEGVTAVAQYACYFGIDGLKEVTLPSTIKKLARDAFGTLTKVTSYATEPAELEVLNDKWWSFDETTFNEATLYVPEGCKEKYEAADGWKNFKNIVEMKKVPEPYALLNEDSTVLTFYYDYDKQAKGGLDVGPIKLIEFPGMWLPDRDWPASITTVVFDDSFADCTSITSTAYWFMLCSELTTIKGIENLNTSNVTDMRQMFYGCSALTSLDLSHFDTSNVTKMGTMFSGCSALETIYCDDTWSCEESSQMFYDCKLLKGAISYDENKTDATYANPTTGYFTATKKVYEVGDSFTADDILYTVSSIDPLEVKVGNGSYSGDPAIDTSTEGVVKLPSSVVGEDGNTYSVTSISAGAFSGCSGVTSVVIPNSVTSIAGCFDWGGFYAGGAFENCGITSLVIPSSVTSIGTGAFSGCGKLTSIVVDEGNTEYDSRDNCNAIIGTNTNVLIAGCNNTVIPEGVTSIGACAFKKCEGLTSLALPNSVTSIGVSAFENCSGLTSIVIPEGVSFIWCFTFNGCSSLTSITIPKSVTFIGRNTTSGDFWDTFSDCSSLTDVYCYAEKAPDASASVFKNSNIENATLHVPAGCKDAYAAAEGWKDFKEIREVVIEDEIAYVPDVEEKTVTVQNSSGESVKEVEIKSAVELDGEKYEVKAIGDGAFENNTTMEKVTIPESVTSIGEKAFAGCTNLKVIYLYAKDPVDLTGKVKTRGGDGEEAEVDVINVFDGVNTETCILYVPVGSKEKYKQAEGWKEFTNIVEMAETAAITIGKNGKTTYCGDQPLDFRGFEDLKAFIATGFDKDEGIIWMTRVKDVPAGVPVMLKGEAEKTYNVPVTVSGSSYYENMFVGNTGEEITINGKSDDGLYLNYYMKGGQFVSVSGTAKIGKNKCYLQLPATFEAATTGDALQVKIAASGKSSFAAPYDLDFTDLGDNLKAFTATGYDSSTKTIWLTRVKKVQKGEGLLLKGTGGETYTIPSSGIQSAYVNMIVGNIEEENLEIGETSDDGTLTNYYLKGGTYMSVSGTANIGINKSYLQLPTEMLAGVRGKDGSDMQTAYGFAELETESMPIIFASIGGDDETTGVVSMDNGQWTMDRASDHWYTLGGQRISKPSKPGLYIKNGRKVVVR
jgi:surface protein